MTEIQKKIRIASNQVSNDVNNALYEVYKMGLDKGFEDASKKANGSKEIWNDAIDNFLINALEEIRDDTCNSSYDARMILQNLAHILKK